MVILGIHDGHDASAALMVDGKIVCAVQEERFSGLKGDYGYPSKSIQYCLQQVENNVGVIDLVALSASKLNPVLSYLKRNANFSVTDWVQEQTDFWHPLKFHGTQVNYLKIFDTKNFIFDKYYNYDGLLDGYMSENDMELFLQRRVNHISNNLEIPKNKIVVTNHENNHKCYALFSSKNRQRDVLILTSEGIGDQYNGTVSIYQNGEIKSLCDMEENHLGHFYQYITLILGMKPNQHEYKVMGLAPFSNEYEAMKAYEVLRKYFTIDGLEVKFASKPKDMYFTIKDQLSHCRFDGIAAGMQLVLENVLCEWVTSCIKETGVSDVVFAGGVAQNIKANQKIAMLPEVSSFFVPPAAGDTSNSIGACFQAAYLSKIEGSKQIKIQPLDTVYLGTDIEKERTLNTIEKYSDILKDFTVLNDIGNFEIAEALFNGKIIGLMRGKMEFGLRALGNRSILANPSDPKTLNRINFQIKNRDFWMPFTPSILEERQDDYFYNPKNLDCRFMTQAYESVPEKRHAFIAAIHPADFSVRPQVVCKATNESYHALICEFERLSGEGVLLNTSLNLHGMPVARDVEEGIHTFLNSKLDALIVGEIGIFR